MAGRGPAPDPDRVRRGKPARGDWTPSPEGGWQHPLPEPPAGISPASAEVWEAWFRSWWAGNWTSDDLPTLRLVIRLWDRVSRGDVKRAAELRQWLDSCGITPKGRQDRRWSLPRPRAPRPWERSDVVRRSASERFAILTGDQPSPGRPTRRIEKSRFRVIAERDLDPRLRRPTE